ncbi:MAG: tripartite tricarboxylate transporter substrate binding protein, partial [Syntrophales bacterium]
MRKIIAAIILSAAMLLPIAAIAADWQPARPVEFVVAAGAGGGSDIFARTVQSIVVKYKLMPQSIVVLNKGGGSGAEGFVYVKSAAGDPH